MGDEGKFAAMVAIILAMLLLLLFVLVNWANSVSCHRQWQHSGMKSSYSVMGGCVIQLPDGTWLPADNYRDIQ
jgi:hypothetical protein